MSPQAPDPYAVFSTNPSSLFTPFTLPLSNAATLTGIAHIPTSGLFHKPLLISIHGASCSAYYFDANPQYTAATYSSLTGIPFVAFNRPNYLGSSGWIRKDDEFKVEEGASHFEEEARWYDEYIFPALWEKFGRPNGCKAIVTNSHSMAGPVTIIAAGYYSQTPPDQRKYPWAGMVTFGIGEEPLQTQIDAAARMATVKWDPNELPLGHEEGSHVGPFPKEDKIALMLGPEGCCEDFLRDLCWQQNTPFPLGELIDLNGIWKEKKDVFKAKVKIPVLYGIGTMEWLWKYEKKHLEMFVKSFVNSPRVEGAVVQGAPHAIEWSRMAGGWWLRVCGWAVEVTTSREMASWGLRGFE